MDVSKLLKKHHDEDEQDENDHLFKVPQARPATTGSSSRGRVARPESENARTPLQFAPTASADSAPSNDRKMSSKLAKAMMIEFQPGTKIVYGSYIKFRSAQGWYLQINRKSGMGTCVQQLSEATTFKVMNEDGDKNFGPSRSGIPFASSSKIKSTGIPRAMCSTLRLEVKWPWISMACPGQECKTPYPP